MKQLGKDGIRQAVRENYGKVATAGRAGCGCAPTCCGTGTEPPADVVSRVLGYSPEEVSAVPAGANLGLGCGNPQAIASLQPGETVLDLGSGAGFDSFLAARAVGDQGHVIGVDMTPEMVAKARRHAATDGVGNVDFRLGEIERLPVADGTVDVIISNCVINLSPEKAQVFREAFRVLRPGGRLAISDIVATAALPEDMHEDLALYTGCMAGASLVDDLQGMLQQAGFQDIRIRPTEESREFIRDWVPGRKIEEYVVSATIEARKPRI